MLVAAAGGSRRGTLWGASDAVGSREAGAAAEAPGLSLAHIRPRGAAGSSSLPDSGFRLAVAEGGQALKLTQIRPGGGPRAGGGVRGVVVGFSPAQRLRALALANSIDRSKVAGSWFVTLGGHPDDINWDNVEGFRCAWLRRLDRRWGDRRYSMLWKKEPHGTGRPHLHGLLFWIDAPPSVHEFRAWNDVAWAEVVGGRSVPGVGVQVKPMRTWNGAIFYTMKYMAKSVEGGVCRTGRVWGVHRRKYLPREIVEKVIRVEVGKKFARVLRRRRERLQERWYLKLDSGEREFLYQARGDARRAVTAVTVADQVAVYKRLGRRVGRIRPACCRRRVVPVYGDFVETTIAGERRGCEKLGDEIHSFGWSNHFGLSAAEAWRLLAFCEAEVRRELEASDDIPF